MWCNKFDTVFSFRLIFFVFGAAEKLEFFSIVKEMRESRQDDDVEGKKKADDEKL